MIYFNNCITSNHSEPVFLHKNNVKISSQSLIKTKTVGAAVRTALMFMSMLSDNHLLVPSWCDARRENAICMPHSHLPATKLIHYALFICLLIHTYVCTHTKLCLGSLRGPVCVCVCVCVHVLSGRPLAI